MQVIITESLKERFGDNMRQLNEITKKVIDDVQTVYKLNFKFLLTWGASIGGMIGPLKNWVEGNIPNLTEYEVSLLVLGAVAQFYYYKYDQYNVIRIYFTYIGGFISSVNRCR